MYIAHPTHGAGTWPNRTQPPTAARKTTLNSGQCVRQPRERRGRNRQPPPLKEKQGGEGGGAKTAHSHQTPANTTRGGQIPHPEGTEDRTPKQAQGDHPATTGNTKPGTAAHQERGHRNMQTHTTKKKKVPAAQPERKGMGAQGPQGPGQGHPATDTTKANQNKKRKAQKTQLDNPAKKGGAQPRPGPSTHADTAHRNRKRRGASGAQNHTRPKSRPKPRPNHEHHKQPAMEGQHHKPCPNTPTQDPSEDWRG